MKFQLLAFSFAIAIAAPHATAAPTEKAAEATAEASPADSYILAEEIPTIVAGETYESSDIMKMVGGKLTLDTPQGEMEGSMEMTETKLMRAKAIYSNKIRILIEKNETSRKTTVNGSEDAPEPEAKPLVGVPVTATLADGKWTAAREDGAEPNAQEAKELKKIAKSISGENDRKMYGTKPRKPGDHWATDPKESLFSDEEDMKDIAGTVEFTFDKVADYNGIKCAFLTCSIDVTGTPGDAEAGADAKMRMSGKVSIIRALDLQVDLDAKMKGSMEMQMKLPNGVALNMTGPMTLSSQVKIVE